MVRPYEIVILISLELDHMFWCLSMPSAFHQPWSAGCGRLNSHHPTIGSGFWTIPFTKTFWSNRGRSRPRNSSARAEQAAPWHVWLAGDHKRDNRQTWLRMRGGERKSLVANLTRLSKLSGSGIVFWIIYICCIDDHFIPFFNKQGNLNGPTIR